MARGFKVAGVSVLAPLCWAVPEHLRLLAMGAVVVMMAVTFVWVVQSEERTARVAWLLSVLHPSSPPSTHDHPDDDSR